MYFFVLGVDNVLLRCYNIDITDREEMEMNKNVIKNKLYNVNSWVIKFKEEKDWENYEAAVKEYTRLCKLLDEN